MSGVAGQPGEDAVPGSEHFVTVHDLAVSGGGMARLSSGMTVFLDNGLPGETLRCRITERKARFARAEALETVTPSPHLAPSFCAYGGECGGCSWTNLDYAAQLAWKERQVKETLRRVGGVVFAAQGTAGAEYPPILGSPKTTRYRNKMEFAFGFAGGVPALGLRRRNSHAVVPVEDCALCAMPVGPILAHVREWLRGNALDVWDGNAGFLRFLVIRCPEYAPGGQRQCLAEIITSPGTPERTAAVRALGKALLAADSGSGVTGFVHSTRRDKVNIAYGDRIITVYGTSTVMEEVGRVRLEAPVQSFLQANTGAAALLYEQARAFAAETGAKVIWDVYCGVGGIALFLDGEGRTVRGVESVAEAVAFARKNAVSAAGEMAFIHGDAARVMHNPTPRPDLVVTDPPRAGMAPEFRDALLRCSPKHIICVSCDAASLARDVAALSGAYRMEKARAVDLFPNTPHVEIVALLSR